MIKDMLKTLDSIDTSKQPEENHPIGGTEVFTEEDIFKTDNILSRLMRAVFVKEKITIQEITFKQREFLIAMDTDPAKFSTARTNLIAALCRTSVSFNKFYEAIVNILGYKMDITITLTKNGESKSFTYSEIVPTQSNQNNNV